MRWLSTVFLLFCTVALSITIAVSVRPLELIVKHILPEGHNVVCIMDEGTNPHLYQLKTSDLKILNEADLIVLVGFEEWAEKVADMFTDKTIVFADDLFRKDFEQDEHLWLDPVNVLLFSHKLMLSFSQIEPASFEKFEANWFDFSKRLLAKLWFWYERVRPLKGKTIVEVHPALTHFAKRFDIGPIFGLETGHEEGITAKRLAELTTLVRRGSVKHIIIDEHVEGTAASKLARQLNLEPIFVDLMGWEVSDYIQLMDLLIEKLASIAESAK
ncbi:metal ABC transporter substrate-binding protein [Pseudothermotoga sp.]